jgi:arylsulfatase A-like enzyme
MKAMSYIARNCLSGVQLLCLALLCVALFRPALAVTQHPNIVIITIDALRADRLSAYGYERPTSPNLDGLINNGVRFTEARTVEPLTNPALSSLITGRYPHQHGASRNGLRMREGLSSLPKALEAQGYSTTAFVSNWTLRDKLSGMGEHFTDYHEILTRARWFGLVRREADAADITSGSLAWLDTHLDQQPERPFLLWVHYIEPHAPYKLQKEYLEPLGIKENTKLSDSDRYDTEIAFVDNSVGELLAGINELVDSQNTIIIFAADHGESMGEHGYWGHGRHLYEPSLRIPMSITWPGQIDAQTIEAPALIIDLAPTILGLLEQQPEEGFGGFDWTAVMNGEVVPPDRVTLYQAHRGAVISRHDSDLLRRSGLLEVGLLQDGKKEIFRIAKNDRKLFELTDDPGEHNDLTGSAADPTDKLSEWMRLVYHGLSNFDTTAPEPLDPESIEQLRSLGYVD